MLKSRSISMNRVHIIQVPVIPDQFLTTRTDALIDEDARNELKQYTIDHRIAVADEATAGATALNRGENPMNENMKTEVVDAVEMPAVHALADHVDAIDEHDVPDTMMGRMRRLPWSAARRREGMTLIEIMIVVTIMAAIMGVVGWFVIGQSDKANVELANTQLKNLKGAVEAYRVYYHKYPSDFEDLVNTPDGTKLIEEVPTDPWGGEYVLEKTGNSVKLYSVGPDETPNNEDDIVVTIEE